MVTTFTGKKFSAWLFLTACFLGYTSTAQADTIVISTNESGRTWDTGIEGDKPYIETYYNFRNLQNPPQPRSKKNGISEFDISGIPPFAAITAVQLEIMTRFPRSTDTISTVLVSGYEGNGVFEPSDYGSGDLPMGIFDVSWESNHLHIVNLDPDALQAVIDNGGQFFGLEYEQVAELPTGASSIGSVFWRDVTLVIEYSADDACSILEEDYEAALSTITQLESDLAIAQDSIDALTGQLDAANVQILDLMAANEALVSAQAQTADGLHEIIALLATPEGQRESGSSYVGENGALLNQILNMLTAPPGQSRNNGKNK